MVTQGTIGSVDSSSLPRLSPPSHASPPWSGNQKTSLLHLSYFHVEFAQKGCLIKLLLHFLYCYYICITLKFPISFEERILMSSENPKYNIPVYFQSRKVSKALVLSKDHWKTNPVTLPSPASDFTPVYPVIKSLHIHKGPQAAAATEARTASSLAAFLRMPGPRSQCWSRPSPLGPRYSSAPFSSHTKYAALVSQVTP